LCAEQKKEEIFHRR